MSEPLIAMPSEGWQTVELGDLCTRGGGGIQTGPFGSQLHASDYVDVGIPSVMPQNIGENRLLMQGMAHVSVGDAERLSRYRLFDGDIVYSRRGDVTRRALITSDHDGWLCGTGCLRVRVGDAAVPQFITYYLGHPAIREWIVRHAVGATMPNLNTKILGELPVTFPSRVKDQQSIANLLGALDDKIAANGRLVSVSRELEYSEFRQALSASQSQEKSLQSMTETLVRGIAPKYSDDHDATMIINQKCIRGGAVDTTLARATVSATVSEMKTLQMNDILVNSTGVGTLGRVARWTRNEKATVDSHVTIVRFNPGEVDPVCAGFAMLVAQSDIEELGEGSTGQTELSRSKLGAHVVSLPSPERMVDLRVKLDSLEAQILNLEVESVTLGKLRDVLLPRLMSGAIRVRDAEKVVEDAT